jgi:hypothetical protein
VGDSRGADGWVGLVRGGQKRADTELPRDLENPTHPLQHSITPQPHNINWDFWRVSCPACPEVGLVIFLSKKEPIKGTSEFMNAIGIEYFKTDLFNFYNVLQQQGYAILAEPDQAEGRRLGNNPEKKKLRGRNVCG